MELLDNILSFKDLQNPYHISEVDVNGRQISVFRCHDVVTVGVDNFYPNIIFYSYELCNYVIPYKEKTMSLRETNVRVQPLTNFSQVDSNFYFFFIYNTDNYYHFVYDTLPYLISYIFMKKLFPQLKLLIGKPLHGGDYHYKFVNEMLELVGIEKSDIEYIKSNCLYKNIFISNSYTHDGLSNKPPRVEIYPFLYNLTKKANISSSSYDSKIYISRRSWMHNDISNIGTNYTTRRKLINENELVEFLQKNNYKEVFTEQLSTKDKLGLFQFASRIVGAIGGGMCNVLFSKPETNVLTIVSPTFLDVNERFKFCFSNTNTSYFTDTVHVEDTKWKRFMRIFHPNTNITGEIVDIQNNELIVQYTNTSVTGWNNSMSLQTISVPKDECEALDCGLNSCWSLNINNITNYI